jgi:hypothetical protein
VEAHQLLLDKIACFARSDFEGTRASFRLMITCVVRRYGFLFRTPPRNICRPYLATANMPVRIAVYRILGVCEDVEALDKLNCAKRQLSFPAEFGGLIVPPLELDVELVHYASFSATLANLITYTESESLGPMYSLIGREPLNLTTSTSPWAVQVRSSFVTISHMDGFSKSDLIVLTNT